jgi:hypothetical protein
MKPSTSTRKNSTPRSSTTRHEILHALFALAATADTTHYWDFAKGNLAGALADLHLPDTLSTATFKETLAELEEKLQTALAHLITLRR